MNILSISQRNLAANGAGSGNAPAFVITERRTPKGRFFITS